MIKKFLFTILIYIPFIMSCSSRDIKLSTEPLIRGVPSRGVSDTLEPEVYFTIVKKTDTGEKEVINGDILTKSDKYAIKFIPENASYVYIFQVDSKNKMVRLFSNPEYLNKDNPLLSKAQYRLPITGKWITLDANKGKEEIIVLAQNAPLADPENICKRVLNGELKQTEAKERRMAGKRKELPYNLFVGKRYFIHK
ncbi:DUF4384 [Desulfonema limicola]|uniref:DUF4384 n=1 Tax=Desulfonema limicola TaxID=45656 RepID=A0A975GGH3_9BACT|nr:DUF4384 domain-containing protein [Desulfonema limicola]QTA80321.1 DUF4384 [Desulfonema limicola]